MGARPTLRELIAPLGSTGYILRLDIRTPEWVFVIGARHQREEDFHSRQAEPSCTSANRSSRIDVQQRALGTMARLK
ncbi:MAG: hypothetical protein ACKOD9_02160, partial [Rubrivivax sp.]